MMRKMILIAAATLLLVGAIAHAQPGEECTVQGGVTAGGGYRLVTLSWKVTGSAGGGDYRLLGPEAPSQRGSGCCCTYMPVLLRDWR